MVLSTTHGVSRAASCCQNVFVLLLLLWPTAPVEQGESDEHYELRQRVQAEQGSAPGEKAIRPSIPRLVDAIRRIGHSPTDAILDICDNAVQANASKIDIFVSGQKTFDRIEVADSGKGMNEELLTEALRLGSIVSYPSGSLSKYGLGLKSAALSQVAALPS